MKKIAVYAFEGVSLFHLSAPTAIFVDAFSPNKRPFSVVICADKKGSLKVSGGLSINIAHDIETLNTADILIFPSWDPSKVPSDALIKIIKRAHQANKMIVGLCLGSFILANAGLLDGKRATTHWAYGKTLAESFPNISYQEDPLYIFEENIVTSAGTAAAIDCCLNIINKLEGTTTANTISRMMVSAPQRSGGQKQFIAHPIHCQASDLRIRDFSEAILADLTQTMTLTQAAKACSMSIRSFSRHFQANFSMSFGEWLTHARLRYSQELLETTHLQITQVAEKAGFKTEQNFRKQFKSAFSLAPNDWRKSFHQKGLK